MLEYCSSTALHTYILYCYTALHTYSALMHVECAARGTALYCACKSGQTLLSRSVAVSRIASGGTAAQFHQPGKRAVLCAVADGVRSAEPSRAEPSRAKHATVGESIDRPAAPIGWGHSALTGTAVGCLREHALQQVGYDGEHRLIGTRASIALDTLARLVLLQHRAPSTDSVPSAAERR